MSQKHSSSEGSKVPRLYPALESSPRWGCGSAPVAPLVLDLSTLLPQDIEGYSVTSVYRNGELMHDTVTSRMLGRSLQPLAASSIEAWACRHPGTDWRIVIIESLRQLVYQRHGEGLWRLVHVGTGIFG